MSKEQQDKDKPEAKELLGKRQPHCQCLYEIENRLPRTQFCFMACADQFEILKARENKKEE